MNRIISWSRNKIIGKKTPNTFEEKLDSVDGALKSKAKEIMKQSEDGRQEKVLMIQWNDEDAPEKCLSQLSDDSAFSSSGCIVHDPSLQLDSDSNKEGHHFNSSLDQDDLSDEELQQHNIDLPTPSEDIKKESYEESFSSLPYQATSPLLSVSTEHGNSIPNQTFNKSLHELVRSTSVEVGSKKVGFRDRLKRISKLGTDRHSLFVDSFHNSEHSCSSLELDSFDIWVSSSFSPKPDSMIEVIRVDPFMRARILSSGSSVTSPTLSSSPSTVAVLQSCSKNKDMAFEKEFQRCLRKGPIKKAGKRLSYCFLFESFLLLAKPKLASIYQLKHVVTLKLLWVSLRASPDADDDASEDDNDRKLPLVKKGIKRPDEDADERKCSSDNNLRKETKLEVPSSHVPISGNSNEIKMESKVNLNNDKNFSNSHHNIHFTPTNDSHSSHETAAVTIGWINEKVRMKTLTFFSETDKKSWMTDIRRQQDVVCSDMEKILIVKVQCYDKEFGIRTKKLGVVRNDTMREVLGKFPKKGISFIFGNLTDFSFGVKFVNSMDNYYLKGSESLFVLQLASDKGLLNGNIDCFTISQARVSSITKQINSRRRRIRRNSKLELCKDFLAYHHAKASLNKQRLFGCSLQEFCLANNNKLPGVVLMLLRMLHEKGPEAEGIFRKSHNQRHLREKVSRLNSFRGSCQQEEIESISVHMAAAIIKYWLMKLKDCLLMSRYYFKWLQVPKMQDKQKQIEEYQKLSKKLPACHLLLLKYLMCVLNRISSAASCNLMSSRNLAVCLGPSILKPSSLVDLNQEKNSVETANDVVETLIRKYEEIFGKVEGTEIFEEEAGKLSEEEWSCKQDDDCQIVKVLSCENLDCIVDHAEDDETCFRGGSFNLATHPLHAPLVKTISSPDSGINECSKEISIDKTASDLNLTATFRDRFFACPDTTDESLSEDSFCHVTSIRKESIVKNFVKESQVNDEGEEKDGNNESMTFQKNSKLDVADGVSEMTDLNSPKGENNLRELHDDGTLESTDKTDKVDCKEESKEETTAGKDGNTSSDSDTLTKGSCIVSNVNSPAVATSKYTFDYPSIKAIQLSRNKSTLKSDKTPEPQENIKRLALIFEKKLKERSKLPINCQSHSSQPFNDTLSELKPSFSSAEETIKPPNQLKDNSAKNHFSLSLKSPECHKARKLPQITEATLRKGVQQNETFFKTRPKSTVGDMSVVEQQIQKFKESEELLYHSVNKKQAIQSRYIHSVSGPRSPTKPIPTVKLPIKITKSESCAAPKYVVEVEVGDANQKNLYSPINTHLKQTLSTHQRGLRESFFSSNLCLADSRSYSQQPSSLAFPQSRKQINLHRSSTLKPLQEYTNDFSSFHPFHNQRSKTPNSSRSIGAPASNTHSEFYDYHKTRSSNLSRRETSSVLGFPIQPEAPTKPYISSVYLSSDDNLADLRTSRSSGKTPYHAASKNYKPSVYRSTFALNF